MLSDVDVKVETVHGDCGGRTGGTMVIYGVFASRVVVSPAHGVTNRL
jgi:hypothetical protein